MPLALDPEYLKAIEPYLPILQNAPKFPVGDYASRRAGGEGLFDLIMPAWPEMSDVNQEVHSVKSDDGNFDIPLFHFTKSGVDKSKPSPVVFYVHGGGYFGLSVQRYRKVLQVYVSQSGIPIIAVNYRLAPEFPFPTPINDAYTALKYVSQHADMFGIDPARIAILGDSAGGGLCAGLAIKARDEGFNPPLAKQMLIGSMLDDRKTARKDEAIAPFATWDYESNLTGWGCYLGSPDKINSSKSGEVHEYAAPSRVSSVKGLPSLYLEVPDMDIFRGENLEYAARIAAENIETEVHVWKGVPHSFELFSPYIETTQIAIRCRVKAMRSI